MADIIESIFKRLDALVKPGEFEFDSIGKIRTVKKYNVNGNSAALCPLGKLIAAETKSRVRTNEPRVLANKLFITCSDAWLIADAADNHQLENLKVRGYRNRLLEACKLVGDTK